MDPEVLIYCGEENNLDYDIEDGEVVDNVREVPGTSKILREEDVGVLVKERGFEEVQGGYKCFCGAKCKRMGALQRHWKHSHSQNIEKFRCLDCHMTTVIEFDVIRHGREKHGWDEERVNLFRSSKPFVGDNKFYLSPKGRVGPEVKKVGRPKAAEKREIEDKENEVDHKVIQKETTQTNEQHDKVKVIENTGEPRVKKRRMQMILEQPEPHCTELITIKRRLKEAMAARELAIRNVEELHNEEKRCYLQKEKVNTEDLRKENKELREENQRLRDFIKAMMSNK